MKRITAFFVVLVLLTSCLMAMPSYGANISSLTASFNSATKVVSVNGVISSGGGKRVAVRITDPNGYLEFFDQTTSLSGGSFSFTYTIFNNTIGTYTVEAFGDGISIPYNTTFSISEGDLSQTTPTPTPPTPTPTPISTPTPAPTPAPLVVSDAEIEKSVELLETVKTAKDAEIAINQTLNLLLAISEKAGGSSVQENTKLLESSLKLINSLNAAIVVLRSETDAVNAALSIIDNVKGIVKNAEAFGASTDAVINSLIDMCQDVVDRVGTQNIRLVGKGATAKINISKFTEDQIRKKIDKMADAAKKLNEALGSVDVDAKVDAAIRIETGLKSSTSTAIFNLPSSLVLAAETAKTDGFVVNMGNSEVKIPVGVISTKKNENIVLTARITSSRLLDSKSRAVVGDSAVLNYTLRVGSKVITEFKTPMEISIPYTPSQNVKIESLKVFMVNRGSLEDMKAVFNKEEGVMTFSTAKLGKFVVMEAK